VIAPLHLAAAFLLDLAIGDPPWLPHPVQVIGKAVSGLEAGLRRVFGERHEAAAGVCLVCIIVPAAWAVAFGLGRLLLSFSTRPLSVIGVCLFVYLVSTTLALRSLIASARLVITAVRQERMADARRRLAMIVGRDTEALEEEAVLRATVETLAENLSDGFVAPLLYLVVGGLPLAMAYKAVNTLDSMVGYKNARYISFGRAAARLDDAANFIPARIAGLAVAVAAFFYFLPGGPKRASSAARASLAVMRRDGRKHSSPNAGVPEAAMAGALGLRLGGPSLYGGALVEKPHIGDEQGADYLRSADAAVCLVVTAASLAVVIALLVLTIGRAP
jgi:adenosylcobinamide-phosphate synthase